MDVQAVLFSVGICFLWWAVAVVGAALSGYPGVICITPAAWLLAIPAGITCVKRSTSARRNLRLAETGLTGAILGLLEGLSCMIVIVAFPDMAGVGGVVAAAASGLLVGIIVGLVGAIVCVVSWEWGVGTA